jgi:hypothetical protein
MGGGKSSGQSQQTIQPMQEQRDLLAAQTGFLKDTALPAYKETVGGAKDVLGNVMPAATTAAGQASDVAGRTSALQEVTGAGSLIGGTTALANLFSPDYERKQVQASLQPTIENTREQFAAQNAMYGGLGGLGSSRMALADKNLQSLTNQRMGTVAATTQAGIEANRAAAARDLIASGQTNLGAANTAAGSRVGYAGVPQDIYNKYASVVYGIPQGNTTPNFAGTQGNTTNSSSKGFKI